MFDSSLWYGRLYGNIAARATRWRISDAKPIRTKALGDCHHQKGASSQSGSQAIVYELDTLQPKAEGSAPLPLDAYLIKPTNHRRSLLNGVNLPWARFGTIPKKAEVPGFPDWY